ncbi:MAG TPA: hypothetical protein VK610_10550 [Rhodothermales bacterium]|nr:hypothetical protein [Rhodothermales bacterium]
MNAPLRLRAGRALLLAVLGLWAGSSAAQRHPTIARADMPIGLGIAQVTPVPGGALRFYAEPGEGVRPEDVVPADIVTFRRGVPSVEIATAPPWLVPEHLKMDYELFHLRVLTLTPDWVEVVGNATTGQSIWVARMDVTFIAWPEFLLGVAAVEVYDSEANPVRYVPHPEGGVLSSRPGALPPLAVRGDWLRVATRDLADRIPPSGWVRWRDGDFLLLTYSPFE